MRVAPSTESRLTRPWFARATWVGRLTRGALFVLPPFLTIAFGVLAARHEAAVGIRDVTAFARGAATAGGEAAKLALERREERQKAAERRNAEGNQRFRRIAPDFLAAVATDNRCVRDSECMKNEGEVLAAYPRRRHEELRILPGGRYSPPTVWHPPCGRRKESVPVCRKNACALEERQLTHPPCDARGYPIQKRVPPSSTSGHSDL